MTRIWIWLALTLALSLASPGAARAGGVDNDCCFPPTWAPAACFADLALTQPIACGTQCFQQGGLILPIVCFPNAGGTCTECDCNDNNAAISPQATEQCADGLDNDCNGLLDAADPACGAPPVCGNDVREGAEDCDGTDDSACPGACNPNCTCGGSCSGFMAPSATVAIHVSETTKAQWGSLGGPHADWQPWHVYGFLMEQLRSDGTPFAVVSDADIEGGALLNAGTPRYAILFSLANDCMSDAAAAQVAAFVSAGADAFIGSTTGTHDENCVLRSTGGPGGPPIYTPAQVAATAQNSFSGAFAPGNTIDANCNNTWANDIADLLPTWIQWAFPATHTLSKVALVHSNYFEIAPPFTYLIRNYEVQVSTTAGCPDGSFTTVATNAGNNVVREFQETTFAPTAALCVRINALFPSWEVNPFPPFNTANWVMLNSFQAFEDGTGLRLIDHPCATPPASNLFALSAEMGLTAGNPLFIGDLKRTGVANSLVSHLENDMVVRGWKLAQSAGASSFNHPQHWAQQAVATTATVLAASGANVPILAVRSHGAGRFVYHSEFNPLAGYSMHTIANLVYGFYRKAVDEAHAAHGLPNVRLGAWPWPSVAGLMTRHDHFSNHGFDGIPGNGDDSAVALIESARGVRGGYFLRTNPALPNSGAPCTDGTFGNTCDTAVQTNLLAMVGLGAEFGTHTLDESQEPSQANIAASLDRLQAYLGSRPTIFVAPGASGVRDTTKQGLLNEGIVTQGDLAFGAHPHFSLRIDTAPEYDDTARWPLVDMPATGYYGTPGGGAFAGGIWAHEISSNPANCNNDGTVRPCMEKVADLQYGLGGLINLYDHIGDPALANPTPAQFAAYIDYAQAKPFVYTTSPLDLHDWWLRRDPVRVSSVYDASGTLEEITVTLSCASDPGPFGVEVDLPWAGGAAVTVDGIPSSSFVLTGNRIRVSAPAPSEVVLTEPCQNNADCDDGLFCNGTESCAAGACSPHSGNPCPGPDGDANCAESCNEASDNCTAADPNGSACSDGLFCTGTDTCAAGACSTHSGNACPGPDGDANCAESCNEATDTCTLADPNGSACNDGNTCTTGEMCNAAGVCGGFTACNTTLTCNVCGSKCTQQGAVCKCG